jgi:hypothetical protein
MANEIQDESGKRGLLPGRTAADIHGSQTQQHVNRDLPLGSGPLVQHTRIMADIRRFVQSRKSIPAIQ